MDSVIRKTMKIKEIEEVLYYHGINLDSWWHIILWGLLYDCDYLEVVGFGNHAEFVKRYN